MENKLKQSIENTLINNLEVDMEDAYVLLETVQTCADYISKEIEEIAIEFASICYKHGRHFTSSNFKHFIEERYKDKA